MLDSYRALDLADERGLYCGKLLADLGCDVIKVEKPGGDSARNIGPFYHDIPDCERSLSWFAYNTNKRSITLNIETTGGQEIFKQLVKGADFVIESFTPGYMDSLGLGYTMLSEVNPKIIMTSISPFGQTGPYKDYKGPDIVPMAMSGYMSLLGDPDRAPVRISVPQVYLHAATDAAIGTLVAHYHRRQIGEGQHVDVSAQESMVWLMFAVHLNWIEDRTIAGCRGGAFRTYPDRGTRQRLTYPCKDGAVGFTLFGGHIGARMQRALVEWMDSEGMTNDFLKGMDWEGLDMYYATQEVIDQIEEPITRFFLTHSKQELYEGAVERRIILAPVSDVEYLAKSPQLDARGFWTKVEHTEIGVAITYPGSFFKSTSTPQRIGRRAPLVGEHNEEIYSKELGISQEQLIVLNQDGII
ncbi:MAG: CoA transferase [Dehalococcoidia bacterium]|nr:CoA transferase [Dehalococcoidia bacterium]